MRKLLTMLGFAAAAGLAAGAVAAEGFPEKPVTIVVPFTAGGGNDITARALGDRLSKLWDQPVVIENRPGAGTAIGTHAVIEAPKDGYTLLFTSSTPLVVNPHVTPQDFDARTDLEPVAQVVVVAPVLAVGKDTPATTMQELIDYARAHPGELNYASPGIGSYTHVGMETLKKLSGTEIEHIPYSGTAPVLTDMLGGRIHMYMVALSVFNELEAAGEVRILGVATEKQMKRRPDIPVIGDTVPGFAVDVWFGLAAPAGTPADVLDKIHDDVMSIVESPEFEDEFLAPNGYEGSTLSRQEFKAKVASDYDAWGVMIEAAGL